MVKDNQLELSDSPNEQRNVNNVQREQPNTKKCTKRKIAIIVTLSIIFVFILIIIYFLFFWGMHIVEKKNVKDKNFSNKEMEIARYNTVIKLNNIIFPTSKSNESYNEEDLNNFYNFTYYFFKNINYRDFSPIGLYSVLINIYMAISDKEQSEILNNILGSNNEERIKFYSKIFNNNYFQNSDGEIKISNGAFYNSDIVEENRLFIEQMSKTYTECYKLSYNKDFNFINEWMSKTLKDNKGSFELNLDDKKNIGILFFSNLYYKQKWKTKFSDSETYKDFFYIDNNNKKEVDFMKHIYYANDYYDYDKYISFYDYYTNNYLIQYIVPKSIKDNILNLISDKNFIYENEIYKKNGIYIELHVPKFRIDNEIDFVPIMEKIGLGKLFNRLYSTINNPFITRNDYNYYLGIFSQKNQVELNEDGTTIKSKTLVSSMVISTSIDPMGVEVKLNQPFIFIIRDNNLLPIFIGYIKEPNY